MKIEPKEPWPDPPPAPAQWTRIGPEHTPQWFNGKNVVLLWYDGKMTFHPDACFGRPAFEHLSGFILLPPPLPNPSSEEIDCAAEEYCATKLDEWSKAVVTEIYIAWRAGVEWHRNRKEKP
jgi:hypothetical protein